MTKTYIEESVAKVGEEVTLMGWVHARRDMGKITFIDLRDSTGLVQVVFLPKDADLLEKAHGLRPEYVIKLTGLVNERPEKLRNPNLKTGGIEIKATSLEVLNEAKTPPFEVDKDTSGVSEELRLTYRYLDLRSERMAKILDLRSQATAALRRILWGGGFREIETPYLTKGTPEGAREFVIPSRNQPGKFYVLPQSPQQFKQLLMVAGTERYFQVARCFRDEDQRGDRQPEFTQIDMEMSFAFDEKDVMEVTEKAMRALVAEVAPDATLTEETFPVMTYAEVMEKYGSDKPDLRKDKENPKELAFLWVVDMPLFEHSDTESRLVSAHHPFTAPKDEDVEMLKTEPAKVNAKAYDLVLNGYEVAGGSIRIHKRDVQNMIFQTLGIPDDEIEARFGHILEAFEFGAPPHGGIAWGWDRLIMLLAGEPNIREVITFPKTGDARDLMMGAPSEVSPSQLADVHIEVRE